MTRRSRHRSLEPTTSPWLVVATPQDRAASVNTFDIAARRIVDVALKQPTALQVKLLNSTTVGVDHWLTVVAPSSPDLVPFFGALAPGSLQVHPALLPIPPGCSMAP